MSTTDQLIAKALSTSSEDEAIACLKMARKKGGAYSVQPQHDYKALAENWRNTALGWKSNYERVDGLLLRAMTAKAKVQLDLDRANLHFALLIAFNVVGALPILIAWILS